MEVEQNTFKRLANQVAEGAGHLRRGNATEPVLQAAEVSSAKGSSANVSRSDLNSDDTDEHNAKIAGQVVGGKSNDRTTEDLVGAEANEKSVEEASPQPSKLLAAIQACRGVGVEAGFVCTQKWGKRVEPILIASLHFLRVYKGSSEQERQAVRADIKKFTGSSREPNADNAALIAVYICVHITRGTKAHKQKLRKEWSRFAAVVSLAEHENIQTSRVAIWLEKRSLNSIVSEWRQINSKKRPPRNISMQKVLAPYQKLIAALVPDSKHHALAMAELAKAEKAIAEAFKRDGASV